MKRIKMLLLVLLLLMGCAWGDSERELNGEYRLTASLSRGEGL